MVQRNLPSKEPATKAAGPYGHPLHPLLVTLPIGAWVASSIFDIVSKVSNDPPAYTNAARWLIGIGVIGALLAALFGLMDLATIPNATPAKRTGFTHLTLNILVTIAFIVSWMLRGNSGVEADGSTSTWLIVLSVVALGVLTVSGFLGGRMTYRYGVRVARENDQADGYEKSATGPRRAA